MISFVAAFLRTAPVPKYLKMHYVKEEIGDSKGVFETGIRQNMYKTHLSYY